MVQVQVQRDMFLWSWYSIPGKWFPEIFETAKPLHIATYEGHVQIFAYDLAMRNQHYSVPQKLGQRNVLSC